jgi:hypothetical protein
MAAEPAMLNGGECGNRSRYLSQRRNTYTVIVKRPAGSEVSRKRICGKWGRSPHASAQNSVELNVGAAGRRCNTIMSCFAEPTGTAHERICMKENTANKHYERLTDANFRALQQKP